MSTKSLIYIGLFLGSTLGSYIPTFFGADIMGGWSIVGSAVGSIIGVWAGYKIGQQYFY